MGAFRGSLTEYREFEPGRWRREDADGNWIEEDGVTTLSDGVAFADVFERRNNPPVPPRLVPKSVIVSRLIEAGKIAAAYQALNSKPEYWARWVASDRPAINHDDPDALALLKAIGADPAVILAP